MRFDLVIVGGGLVGAGLAVALKDSNLSIALIDDRLPDNNDARLFALNYYSCQFLQNLGVWNQLSEFASPIEQVHVSSRGHFGAMKLNCEDVNLRALGYVVPAGKIEHELNNRLLSLPNITLYRPAKLNTLTQQDDAAVLCLSIADKEIEVQAGVVIAADGTFSTVRSQLQITTEEVDYGQRAIVTRTTLKRPHAQIAYERFNAEGAIAMLPLPNNECATIWSADNALAESLMALDDQGFVAALQNEFGYRLGKLEKISKRHSFPLRLVRANKMAEGRILLLGNSMHTMHPIAAQGFNLALYEVATLVDLIAEHSSNGLTPASLQQIGEQVAKHQQNSISMSHRLAGLFSGEIALKNHALSLGMAGLNMLRPAKRKFINMMMGKTGTMPSLLMDRQDEKHFATSN